MRSSINRSLDRKAGSPYQTFNVDANPSYLNSSSYSNRLHKKQTRTKTLQTITKALFLFGSLGLIVVAALRFTLVDSESVHEIIINCFYLLFGLIVILIQLNVERVIAKVRFSQYYWGKCLLSLFLASMAFSNSVEPFLQYIISVYFLILACLFAILACLDRKRDKQ